MYSMTLLAALLFPAVTTAVPSLGDRVVAGFLTQLHLPLSVSEATDAGWTSVTGDPKACDAVSGRRFRLGELLTPTLVFDNTPLHARDSAYYASRRTLLAAQPSVPDAAPASPRIGRDRWIPSLSGQTPSGLLLLSPPAYAP